MFQPQPTPYGSFGVYGVGQLYPGFPDYSTVQQTPVAPSSAAGGIGGGLALAESGAGGAATPNSHSPPGSDGGASLVFTAPAFSPGGPGAPTAHHFPPYHSAVAAAHSQTPRHPRHIKMEPNLSDDLAAQEAAAREYQPQLEGPLVGDKKPSHAITEEYAKADPVYVQKTLALPQSYSHYRQIRGDGNCGWRAIGFSYLETLVKTGDRALLESERLRLTQTPIIGHDAFVYEDMKEETDILMKELAAKLGNQQEALALLLQKFNDPEVANPILYYFRLLASSWLKGDPGAREYIDFIPEGLGIQGYCQEYLELPGREIEHLGLIILSNALLKPVGFVLEIAYLDRSAGPTVNTYRIPDDANSQDLSTLGPVIYLLFRPDHYDILYREGPSVPIDIQVHNVSSFTHRHDVTSNTDLDTFAAVDFTPLAAIPGLNGLVPGLSGLDMTGDSAMDPYSGVSAAPWGSALYDGTGTVGLPDHQTPAAAAAMPAVERAQTPPLRFSEYCHPSFVESDAWHEPPLTTNTFKNSHFNVAHYNNPNFQPEEYKPDADDANETRSTGRKRGSS
ncbi:hypothetical protein VTK73DRAFT_9791 [Phialemonium thermophilum]|uniref:ubiquitinyl hydrolase 1 n=1 Tax=Phialemonium thermophilum TaxID=223376 RepID=A0ABR3W097_9PEZI